MTKTTKEAPVTTTSSINNTSISIGIRRLDGTTFQLFEVDGGKETILLTEIYPIVQSRAMDILRAQAEGTYNG